MDANRSKKLLDSIRRRPGMFWGGGDHPFTSLVAFVSGFQIGAWESGAEGRDLVPEDFHRFVTEHFGEQFPAGGKGWMTFIKEHTASEQEAFELFFELRNEYDKKKADIAEPNAGDNAG